ncbi:MAG: structural cement protein Gp24 [Janthinobacterium lividum]
MPATQTTYGDLAVGLPGHVFNMEGQNSITRTIEDPDGVGFGIAVFQGVTDLGITKTPGTLFKGVTIIDVTTVRTESSAVKVDVYPPKINVGVHDKGVILVAVTAAVAAGAPAFVSPTFAWSSTATGNTAVPATFDSSTTGAGLAKLRIR